MASLSLDTSGYRQGMMQAQATMQLFPSWVSSYLASPLLGLVDVLGTTTSAIGGFLSGGLALATQFEQIEVAYEVLLGSAERANALLDDLTQFAAATPFQYDALAKATGQMLGFGFAAEDVLPTLRNIGDVAAGLNIPIGELAEVYSKQLATGRIQTQDLMAFANRGIPIIRTFAEMFGVAESEIVAMASSGQIEFSHLEQAFARMTGEGGQFQDMMQRQSQTVGGAISNLKDNWEDLQWGVGKAILEHFRVAAAVAGVTGLIIAAKGPIVELADVWSERLGTAVWQSGEAIVAWQAAFRVEHADAIAAAMSGLGTAMGFVAEHARTLTGAFVGLGTFLASGVIVTAVSAISPVLLLLTTRMLAAAVGAKTLSAALTMLTTPLGLLRMSLAALAVVAVASPESLGPLAGAFTFVREAAGDLRAMLTGRLIPAVGEQFKAAFAVVADYLPTYDEAMSAVTGTLGTVVGFVSDVVVPTVGEVLVAGLTIAAGAFERFRGVARAVFDAVSTAVRTAGEFIAENFTVIAQVVGAVSAVLLAAALPAIFTAIAAKAAVLGAVLVGPLVAAFTAVAGVVTAVAGAMSLPVVAIGLLGAAVGWILAELVPWSDVWENVKSAMATVADYVTTSLVPAVGEMLVAAWQRLSPVVDAARGVIETVLGVMRSAGQWVSETLVPTIGGWLVGAIRAVYPVLEGLGRLASGVYQLAVGIATHTLRQITPVISFVGSAIGVVSSVLGWGFRHVLWPVTRFVGDVVLGLLSAVGRVLGWLIGRIGDFLGWLGRAIGGTRDLADGATDAADAVTEAMTPRVPDAPPPPAATPPVTPTTPTTPTTPPAEDAPDGPVPAMPAPEVAVTDADQAAAEAQAEAARAMEEAMAALPPLPAVEVSVPVATAVEPDEGEAGQAVADPREAVEAIGSVENRREELDAAFASELKIRVDAGESDEEIETFRRDYLDGVRALAVEGAREAGVARARATREAAAKERAAGQSAVRVAAAGGADRDELAAIRLASANKIREIEKAARAEAAAALDARRKALQQAARDSRSPPQADATTVTPDEPAVEAAAEVAAEVGEVAAAAGEGDEAMRTFSDTLAGNTTTALDGARSAAAGLGDTIRSGLAAALAAGAAAMSGYAGEATLAGRELDRMARSAERAASAAARMPTAATFAAAGGSRGAGGAGQQGGPQIGDINVAAPDEARLARLVAGEVEDLVNRRVDDRLSALRAGVGSIRVRGGL